MIELSNNVTDACTPHTTQ